MQATKPRNRKKCEPLEDTSQQNIEDAPNDVESHEPEPPIVPGPQIEVETQNITNENNNNSAEIPALLSATEGGILSLLESANKQGGLNQSNGSDTNITESLYPSLSMGQDISQEVVKTVEIEPVVQHEELKTEHSDSQHTTLVESSVTEQSTLSEQQTEKPLSSDESPQEKEHQPQPQQGIETPQETASVQELVQETAQPHVATQPVQPIQIIQQILPPVESVKVPEMSVINIERSKEASELYRNEISWMVKSVAIDWDDPKFQQSKIPHPSAFYNLVQSYHQNATHLAKHKQGMEVSRAFCHQFGTTVWDFQTQIATLKNYCKDKKHVTETLEYKVAALNQERYAVFRTHVDKFRENITEGFVSIIYETKISKLSAQSYLDDFLNQESLRSHVNAEPESDPGLTPGYALLNIPNSVVQPVQRGMLTRDTILELRHYVEVLFYFERMQSVTERKKAVRHSVHANNPTAPPVGPPNPAEAPSEPIPEFYEDVRHWLKYLLGVLCTCGDNSDYLFILQQLVTSPNHSLWEGHSFIQFNTVHAQAATPGEDKKDLVFFLAMLSVLMKPVVTLLDLPKPVQPNPSTAEVNGEGTRNRKSSVSSTKNGNLSKRSSATVRGPVPINLNNDWVLLPGANKLALKEGAFFMLTEDDFLKLFDQFPFATYMNLLFSQNVRAMIELIFTMQVKESLRYSTHLVDLLCASLVTITTINKQLTQVAELAKTNPHQTTESLDTPIATYKHLIQLVTRTLENILQSANDLLLTPYVSVAVGTNLASTRNANAPELAEYQAQYNQIFLKTVETLVQIGCRMGISQYLSTLPYGTVKYEPQVLWKVLHNIIELKRGMVEYTTSLTCLDQSTVATSLQQWRTYMDSTPTIRSFFVKTLLTEGDESVFFLHAMASIAMKSSNIEIASAVAVELFKIAYMTPDASTTFFRPVREMLDLLCSEYGNDLFNLIFSLVKAHIHHLGRAALYVYHGLKLSDWRPTVEFFATFKEYLLQPLGASEVTLAQFILDHLSWTKLEPNSEPFLGRVFHQNALVLFIEVYMEHKTRPHQDSSAMSAFVTWLWPRLFNCLLCNEGREHYMPLLDIADPKVAVLRKHFNVNSHIPLEEVVVDPVIAFGVLRLTKLGVAPFTKYTLPLWKSLLENKQYDACILLLDELMPSIIRGNVTMEDPKLFVTVVKNILHHDATFPVANAGLFQSIKQTLFSDSPAKQPLTDNTLSFNSFLLNTFYGTADDSAITKFRDLNYTNSFASFWFNAILSIEKWEEDQNSCFLLNSILKLATLYSNTSLVTSMALRNSNSDKSYQGAYKGSLLHTLHTMLVKDMLQWPDKSIKSNVEVLLLKSKNTASILAHRGPTWCKQVTYLALDVLYAQSSLMVTELIKDKSLITPKQKEVLVEYILDVANSCCFLGTEMDPSEPLLPLYWQLYFQLNFLQIETTPQPVFLGMSSTKHKRKSVSATNQVIASRLEYLSQYHRSVSERERTKMITLNNSGSQILNTALIEQHDKLYLLFSAMALWSRDYPLQLMAGLTAHKLTENYFPLRLNLAFTENPCFEDTSRWLLWYDVITWNIVKEDISTQASHYVQKKLSWALHNVSLVTPVRASKPPQPLIKWNDNQCVQLPAVGIMPPIIVSLNIEQDSKVIEKELFSMLGSAEEYSAKLSRYASIDSLYIDMIGVLWSNVLTPVSKKKKCSQGCTGAAKFFFEVKQATMSEDVNKSIQENRNEELNLTINTDIRLDMCITILKIRKTVEKLESLAKSNSKTSEAYSKVGSLLFYRLVDLNTSSTLLYPPTRSFLSTTVQLLGSYFINNVASEVYPLVNCIARDPIRRVPVLYQLLNPLLDLTTFKDSFKSAVEAALKLFEHQEMACQLLHRFNMTLWIHTNPSANDVMACLSIIGSAITELFVKRMQGNPLIAAPNVRHSSPSHGYNPYAESEKFMIAGFNTLVEYAFPANLIGNEISAKSHNAGSLRIVLDLTTQRSVPVEVWQALIELPFHDPVGNSPSAISRDTFIQAVDMLAQYFAHWRKVAELSNKQPADTIYDIVTPEVLNNIMKFVNQLLKLKLLFSSLYNIVPANESTLGWQSLTRMYDPWLIAQTDAVNKINSAWLPHHQAQATAVIASFVSNMLHFQSTNDKTIFDTWKYIESRFGQVTAVAHHIQQVLYNEFSRLPWKFMTSFDNSVLVRMMDVIKPIVQLPQIPPLFFLVRDVVLEIPWHHVRIIGDEAEFSGNFLRLLMLLVRLHPVPLSAEFVNFLDKLNFDWNKLPAEAFTALLYDHSYWATLLHSINVDPLNQDRMCTILNLVSTASGFDLLKDVQTRESYQTHYAKLRSCVRIHVYCMTALSVSQLPAEKQPALPPKVNDANVQQQPQAPLQPQLIKTLTVILNRLFGHIYLFSRVDTTHMDSPSLASSSESKSISGSGNYDLTGSNNVPNAIEPNGGNVPSRAAIEQQQFVVEIFKNFLELFNSSVIPIQLVVELMLQQYPVLACPYLISAACVTIASTAKLAYLTEYCLECYFLVSTNWNVPVTVIRIPELDEKGFISLCNSQGFILTLYTHILQRLAKARQHEERIGILNDLIFYTNQMNLSVLPGNEHKMFLLYHKIIEMLWEYLHAHPNDKDRVAALTQLSSLLTKLSDFRTSSGFLGAIGLGSSKSPYPAQFRLGCRLLSAWIMSQVKDNGTVRVNPSEPVQKQAVEKYMAHFLKSAEFSPSTSIVQTVMNIIKDPSKTLTHETSLLFAITSRLYPSHKYFNSLGSQ